MFTMRKSSFITGMLLCSSLFLPEGAQAAYVETFEVGLDGGYRIDELNWNIGGNMLDSAGSVNYVNVLSELTWEEVESYQLGIAAKLAFGSEETSALTYFRGNFNYGWILDGEVQDSDYAGHNRTLEFSRSTSLAEDDDVLDASFGIGLKFELFSRRFTLAPVGGFSYHEQNFRMNDGVQTVSDPTLVAPGYEPPPVGTTFYNLNSTYRTEWKGPWLGYDFELLPSRFFRLFGTFEYHWANYEAKANWNLRPSFAHPVSYKHDATDATGVVVSLGSRFDFSRAIALHLSLHYQDWTAEDGTDIVYFSDGTIGQTPLNEVSWESYAAIMGVDFKFY